MGALLLLLFALSCGTAPAGPPAGKEKPAGLPDLERRMVELVNVEREARGISALVPSPDLTQVARDYSARMAATGQINHDLAPPVEERVRAVRPDVCTFGENVSKHTSIDYSLGDLMLSPGHRANLLNPRFTEIGIGIVHGPDDFLYITQEFTRPCQGRPAPGKRRAR